MLIANHKTRNPFYKPGNWIVILTFFIFSHISYAQQYHCLGKVYDEETGRSMAFVNIVANNSNIGTATDIDGKFLVVSETPINLLRFSYVGYESLVIEILGEANNLVIHLRRSATELREIVILAGENPAHRIIQKVIENRDKNDPEQLKSFSYTSYDKMIFTIDTLEIPEEANEVGDSSSYKIKKFLKDKDFFLMETVSERKYLAPDRNHEKIIATRISGFKDPLLLFLSSQLQSTSFYKELIKIGDKNYINPLLKGSFKKYFFMIEDTTYTPNFDTLFIISFKQRDNTNFEGLKGVLTINSNGWAIQNVIAEPSATNDGISMVIQQKYEFIDDKYWFPVQLNTDIIFNNVSIEGFSPKGQGKSYLKDIVLNPDMVKRDFKRETIGFDLLAGERDEVFWNIYRNDSLSERDQKTYSFIDSIGEKANLDRKVKTLKALIDNRLPVGFMDINLSKLIHYNQHEGLYLGLGLLTNQKFSETISIGGFWGYGLHDKRAKYGGDVTLLLNRYKDTKLKIGYYDFATETGGTTFFDDSENAFNPAMYRQFYIKRMDQTTRMEAAFSFKPHRYANLNFGFHRDKKIPTYEYLFQKSDTYIEDNVVQNNFHFTGFSSGFRLAIKEKFLQMPDTRISLGTNWPVIWFNYTLGVGGLLESEFSYNKFDVKVEYKKFFRYFGESKIIIRGGFIDKPIPCANLYNGMGAYSKFAIYATEAFVTMDATEFLADQYLFAFYSHSFGKLLFGNRRFAPELSIASNFGIGDLNQSQYHQGIDFKVMNQLYCESGLLLNNLLKFQGFYSLGASVFYRYGYYHYPIISNNFTYRIVLNYFF